MFQKISFLLFFTSSFYHIESFYPTRKPLSTLELAQQSYITHSSTQSPIVVACPMSRTIQQSIRDIFSQTTSVFLRPYLFTKYILQTLQNPKKDSYQTPVPGPTMTPPYNLCN